MIKLPRLLPFAYATRNLLRDPGRFIQKVGGSGLVVFLVFAAGSFNAGMEEVLRASGSEQNVILLGAGSEESVERSEIPVQTETLAAAGISGIARSLDMPAISGEVHFMGELSLPGMEPAQGLLRGITPSAFGVHTEVRIIEGRFPGSGEVIVGRLAYHVIGAEKEEMGVGGRIEFEGQTFDIVGIFEAPGTVMESEVWMDRVDLMTLTQRETLSCVIARLGDPMDFDSADLFAKQRLDLELSAIRESAYYDKVSAFFGPVRAMTWLTAGLIAAGAVFGGFNMLYAAFASRIRELATLQAVGFSRGAVFVSLVQESLLSTLTGTILAAFLSVWLLEGQTVQFSIGTFFLQLTPTVVLAGLITGLLLGLLGSIPPAVRCLGAPLPSALRS
jgi:ABC-type antimicrobial peptide transport system permease subunit